MSKTRTIRILILGDSGVGKTTFISTLISQPGDEVEKVLRPVLLPTNMCIVAPNVFTQIVDTCETTDFETQLQHAHLVLIMYDMTQQTSIDNLTDRWLPLVKQYNSKIPIILIGNKMDKKQLKDSIGIKPIRDIMKMTIKKYRQIEIGLECSAYYNQNINETLNAAHQSVIYPLKPLVDMSDKSITQKLKKALTCIFRILDKDYDGILSDKQMSFLQERVFGSQLDNYDLNRIRQLIKVQLENYELRQISLDGFIALQKKCIDTLNFQIVWGILRQFKYNDELQFASSKNSLIFEQEQGVSVELRSQPILFLTKLFNYYNEQQNRKQDRSIIEQIFYPLQQIPFPQLKNKKEIEISELILTCHYYTYLDYLRCYDILRKIGYDRSLQNTFTITNKKVSWKDMKKLKFRNVLCVGIFENDKYSNYIDTLFPLQNVVEFQCIRSNYILFSSENTSKVMIILKLNQKNYKRFSQNTKHKRRIDVITYFQQDKDKLQQILNQFDSSIIQKCITKENVEKNLKIQRLSSLDLQSFPIVYKKSNTNHFYNFIWETILNMQQEYSKQTISMLKKQDGNSLIAIASTALAFSALGLFFGVKYLRNNK